MPTRILSVFSFLMRVGFAVLFLGCGAGYCAWDTDPQNPTFLWDTSTDPTIVEDGLGGAFFAFSISGSYWPHIGHVDANGEQTFPEGGHPYENLLPVDEPEYAGTPRGTTLVRSGSPGTVVAVHERIMDGAYGGFVFSQFNTSGSSGFGSIGYIGQDYRLLQLQSDDDHGWTTIAGDLDGGVHFVMRGPQIDGQPTKYYNHISSQGQYMYEWPGLLLQQSSWATFLFEDGCGGAFLMQIEVPRDQLHGLWGQRFDSNGQPQWGSNGFLIHDAIEYLWGQFDLMSPGKLIFWGREEVVEDSFLHYGYCIDTTGSMVWGEDGIAFELEGSEIAYLTPDRVGGFFYHSFSPAGYGNAGHYDGNGNLIATAPWYSVAADYADGLGGAYNSRLVDHVPPRDTLQIEYDRFDSNLFMPWESPAVVVEVMSGYYGHVAVPDGQNGLIGFASTSPGMVFYHLNPDGSIGPNLGVPDDRLRLIPSVQLVSTYPNPFNSTLNIAYSLSTWQVGRLVVFDVLGRIVYAQPIDVSGRATISSSLWASGSYVIYIETTIENQTIRSNARRVVLAK